MAASCLCFIHLFFWAIEVLVTDTDHPSPQQVQNPKSNVVGKTFPSAADMDDLSKKCDKLTALRANVLRTTSFGTVAWERKDGKWTGGVKQGTAAAEAASAEAIAAEAQAARARP